MRFWPIVLAAAALGVFPVVAMAQQASFDLELVSADSVDSKCSIILLAQNKLGSDIAQASFEVFIRGADKKLRGPYSFSFAAIANGKQKAKKFNLPDAVQSCDKIKKMMWNQFTVCKGDKDLTDLCNTAANISSSVDSIEFNNNAE